MRLNTTYSESKHPILLLADSVQKLQEDKFSTSSRMNRFLTNVNKLPIVAKHLSANFDPNQVADLQSRYTPPFNASNCSVHRFIDEVANTVVDSAARCSSFQVDASFAN